MEFRARIWVGIRIVFVAMMFSATAPPNAEASIWCWLFGSGCGGSREASSQQGVPEIDPGALVSAIALAAGGVAMLSDRVRRRR